MSSKLNTGKVDFKMFYSRQFSVKSYLYKIMSAGAYLLTELKGFLDEKNHVERSFLPIRHASAALK
jgi:hypothetical protein